MNRLQACALVLVLWAAIYLPGLGSTELKGEEGRRILPAITMLETGNWLVPYVGGKPFLRKPPLVNWAIAASFKMTGVRNEWTARLPSALCVLALALTIVATSGPGWIGVEAGFVAAIMAMTQFGLLAKARFAGAEIEGIYVPLSGIAIVSWLGWWAQGRSPWLVWTVPGVFLGLASLAKGPSFHFIFFYAIVFTVIGRAKRWRDLAHPAHFTALAIAGGLFAAWAVPYFRTPEAKGAAAVWKRQGIDRFTESEFNAENYFLNLPRGLMDQLPWVLLAPALVAVMRRRARPTFSGAGVPPAASGAAAPAAQVCAGGTPASLAVSLTSVALAVGACFVLVLLVPGTLPRYVLPLGAPLSILLAWAVTGEGASEALRRRWHLANKLLAVLVLVLALVAPLAAGAALGVGGVHEALRGLDFAVAFRSGLVSAPVIAGCALVLARSAARLTAAWLAGMSGGLLGAGLLLYAVAAVRWINRADDIRPLARAIDAAVSAGDSLVIYDSGYLAAIFYLRTPYRYAATIEAIPADTEWVLARERERSKLDEKRPDLAVAQIIHGKRKDEFLLLQRRREIQKLPAR
ncbi:MAG: hypothetical protein QOE70_3528 [Chthoniobacter sp.]|nr:hypothetical protein [Chthoniobacter sp.]